jgi:GntR family transcriptional repressor for pyruvate dehydrogenase complex
MRPTGTLASQIAGHVQDLIAAGALRPGDRLPAERELADLLAVGRSSVREAVQSLAALGVVSVRHGDGVFVAPAPGEHQPAVSGTDPQWVSEFYAMREALEAPAARRAACNATPHTITGLEEAYTRASAATASGCRPAERWQLNAAFHEAITELTGNRLLLNTTRALNQAATMSLRTLIPASGRGGARATGHAAILEAVKAGDAWAAERAARAHVQAAHKAARIRAARLCGHADVIARKPGRVQPGDQPGRYHFGAERLLGPEHLAAHGPR